MTDEDKKTEDSTPYFERETTWMQFVLMAAGVYGVGLVFGTLVLVFAGTDDLLESTEIFWRLAVIGGAVVTFTAIMWRGLIASDQARQQRMQVDNQQRQLANVAKQIEQTDESNLAALLQDGANLLAAEEPTHRVAGIASLEVVAAGVNDRLGEAAMNLLADFISRSQGEKTDPTYIEAAIEALNRGFEERDRVAKRQLSFTNTTNGPQHTFVFGVQRAEFKKGIIRSIQFDRLDPAHQYYRFETVTLIGCRKVSIVKNAFRECKFLSCSFEYTNSAAIRQNEFINCDFSDAIFLDKTPSEIYGERNHFYADSPPQRLMLNTVEPLEPIPPWLIEQPKPPTTAA